MPDVQRQEQRLGEQRRLLQELAELNQGGDFQTRQRIHELTERIAQQRSLLIAIKKSLAELQPELDRLRALDADYRVKADRLRKQEKGPQP